MQLCNIQLRLGGSLLHTVPKTDVTPAEILVLRALHGEDAVTSVRPTKFDKTRRHEAEFERLSTLYDRAASASAPGEEAKSVMGTLFPGAMKKLPVHLKDIGLGYLLSPSSVAAAAREDADQAALDAARKGALEAAVPVPNEDDEPDEPAADIFTPPAGDDSESEAV